jgi:hypothetical protein
MGHTARQEDRIDRLLDVAHQEEPSRAHHHVEDDRDVVDAATRVGRFARHGARVGPQDPERRIVDLETVSGREMPAPGPVAVEQPGERDIAGSGACHPRLEEPPDAISPQKTDHPGGVVLVWVREDHQVDAPIPRRDPVVQHGA